MKHQKVRLDEWKLFYGTIYYLLLAFAMWILLRLVIACIRYPRFIRRLQHIQELGDTATIEISEDDTCTGLGQQCPPPTVKIEKVNGGLRIFGIVVGKNCQLSLPAFGLIFIFIGVILTVVAFKEPNNEDRIDLESRGETQRNLRILGPICIVFGIGMLLFAIMLRFLSKKARERQTRIGFYCPVHGDFYPLSPGINPRKYSFPELAHEKSCWPLNCVTKHESSDPIVTDIPPCPHSISPSNRSSFDAQHLHLNSGLNPTTVVITAADSNGYFVTNENENTYHSSRSLSVPNDVISFPSFRSSSNPPTSSATPLHSSTPNVKRLSCPILPDIGTISPLQLEKLTRPSTILSCAKAELKVVQPATWIDRSPSHSLVSSDEELKKRKSVSILLPLEEYHTRIDD